MNTDGAPKGTWWWKKDEMGEKNLCEC